MKNNYLEPIIKIMLSTTAWIVGPVLMGAFLGKWLDQKFNSEPWLFLATIGFCFIISMCGLITNALKEFKKIEKEYNKEKEPK